MSESNTNDEDLAPRYKQQDLPHLTIRQIWRWKKAAGGDLNVMHALLHPMKSLATKYTTFHSNDIYDEIHAKAILLNASETCFRESGAVLGSPGIVNLIREAEGLAEAYRWGIHLQDGGVDSGNHPRDVPLIDLVKEKNRKDLEALGKARDAIILQEAKLRRGQ